ncbi:hypothetical protein B0T25DRAFT_564207 [Lasiosphaeria hispida]|uniref:Uncharacterized protein n=1 Tax=Lasiosphaeria hispida TaxID=260671 RepID=A0AAJ0HPP8_9PEZI|nr:hypothetical protein B0T25DRAFT_564207 [Lasiosphaeria hispida]
MKFTLPALLLCAAHSGLAAPRPSPPPDVNIVRIDMDALTTRNESSLVSRAPIAGANLDAWTGSTSCSGSPSFTWGAPDPNNCYEYWSGGLRWEIKSAKFRPGPVGAGCALRLYPGAGCTGSPNNWVAGNCGGGGGWWSAKIIGSCG